MTNKSVGCVRPTFTCKSPSSSRPAPAMFPESGSLFNGARWIQRGHGDEVFVARSALPQPRTTISFFTHKIEHIFRNIQILGTSDSKYASITPSTFFPPSLLSRFSPSQSIPWWMQCRFVQFKFPALALLARRMLGQRASIAPLRTPCSKSFFFFSFGIVTTNASNLRIGFGLCLQRNALAFCNGPWRGYKNQIQRTTLLALVHSES